MASKIQAMRSGGTQHPEEIVNFLMSRMVKGEGGVFDKANGGLAVAQQSVPDMSVKIAEGYAMLRKSTSSMVYPVRIYDGVYDVNITSNSSGFTRIDAIVLYVNLGASPNADVTNVGTLVAVEGTPSGSPTAPTDGDIESDIGASNPFVRLADITVANGATSIVTANISDQRTGCIFVSPETPTDDDDIANKAYVDANGFNQYTAPTTTIAGKINFLEGTSNGTNKTVLKGADNQASDTTLTLPSVTGTLVAFENMNAPRGFLLNGKIVPSVSSNNLTVAIKGLDGNDPSATNPVYVRIGDTIRTITSALSVTKNAGTNWFNAGSSELATKEIDYFVYLGYNSTDGVVIGFSRIPYATEYDDFSTTSTNEKYCAISTITNAVSGDDYELIGRFAATLSAGAGYTWSVPTFTNKNLIQEKTKNTRKINFTPIVTALVGSITSYTVNSANYSLVNGKLFFFVDVTITNAGTASAGGNITIPFSPSSTFCLSGAEIASTGKMTINRTNASNSFRVVFYDNTNPIVTNYEIIVGGFVQID